MNELTLLENSKKGQTTERKAKVERGTHGRRKRKEQIKKKMGHKIK
jgi:hypothetical protein